MRSNLRKWLAIAAVPVLVLLPGCVKLTADITIKSEDDITVVMDLAMVESEAATYGYTADTVCNTDSGLEVGDAKVEPYTADGYIGCKISGNGTIDDMGGDGISLADNVWTFEMAGSEVTDPSAGITAAMFDEFRISVTFPGKALTASGSGEINGNTVTWSDVNDLISAEGLKATGENTSSFPWVWLIVGIAALGLVGGGVAYFVTQRNKSNGQGQVPPGQGYPQALDAQGQPYGAPQGYQPPPQQGYQPPPQQGYQPPAQQGYQPPAQQGYQAPPANQGYAPQAPPAEGYPTRPSASPSYPPAGDAGSEAQGNQPGAQQDWQNPNQPPTS